MIDELAQTDHIVVAGFTVIQDVQMIIGAGGEGAGRMTNAAIFDCHHMTAIDGLTACFSCDTGVTAGCRAIAR